MSIKTSNQIIEDLIAKIENEKSAMLLYTYVLDQLPTWLGDGTYKAKLNHVDATGSDTLSNTFRTDASLILAQLYDHNRFSRHAAWSGYVCLAAIGFFFLCVELIEGGDFNYGDELFTILATVVGVCIFMIGLGSFYTLKNQSANIDQSTNNLFDLMNDKLTAGLKEVLHEPAIPAKPKPVVPSGNEHVDALARAQKRAADNPGAENVATAVTETLFAQYVRVNASVIKVSEIPDANNLQKVLASKMEVSKEALVSNLRQMKTP